MKVKRLSLLIVIALITGVLLIVSACAPTVKQPSEEAAKAERLKLVVAGDGGANQVAWLWSKDEMEEEFNVQLEVIPLSFEDLYTKLKNEFVAGTGAYDIVVFFPKYLGDFVENKYLLPLDDYISKWDPGVSDIVPAFYSLYCKWGGITYTLPYDGDVLALFYRTDIFNDPTEKENFQAKYGHELRPPETWDEYFEIAEFFTRKAGEKLMGKTLESDFYGVATYGQKDFQYCWFMNHAASRGVGYFDENMNPVINTPEAIEALEEFKKEFTYAPPESPTFGFDELQAAFLDGILAMEIQWTDPGRCGQNPAISKIVGKIGTATIPGFKREDGSVNKKAVLAAGRVMAITKWADNPELSYQIIRFMAQEASLGYVSSPTSGQDPFRFSHYDNPGAFEMFSNPEDAKDYLNGIRENLKIGFPELNIPGAQQYLDILSVNINTYISSQTMTAKQALDDTAKKWDGITDKLGRDKMIKAYRTMLESWKEVGLD